MLALRRPSWVLILTVLACAVCAGVCYCAPGADLDSSSGAPSRDTAQAEAAPGGDLGGSGGISSRHPAKAGSVAKARIEPVHGLDRSGGAPSRHPAKAGSVAKAATAPGGDLGRSGGAPSRHAKKAGTEPGHYESVAKVGTDPVQYDGKPDGKQTSGEQDFLASLESAQKPETKAKEPPVYVTLVRFGLSLALVLGLAYATILGLKRFTNLKTGLGTHQGCMRVVENLPLGANRALHLVEIGSRKLVVASTPSSVSMVTEIAQDELPEVTPTPPPTTFKEQFAAFLGNKTGSDDAAGNVARILRESTSTLQGKIAQLGSIRGRLRDV